MFFVALVHVVVNGCINTCTSTTRQLMDKGRQNVTLRVTFSRNIEEEPVPDCTEL